MADTATVEQVNTTGSENNQEGRTFTQEEVNAIVEGRVAKERSRYADYETLQAKASKFDEMEEASKTELQKATEKANSLQKQLDDMTKATELRNIRDKVAQETGVPVNLLSEETEEACKTQAQAILEFAGSKSVGYPSVKDGGEVANVSAKTNGQLFGDWLNSQLAK